MNTEEGIDAVAIESSDGSLRATFVPGAGMLCSSLLHRGEELLARRSGVRAYAEHGTTMGLPLLYPWANRLASFSYGSAPNLIELPKADPLLKLDSSGLPIHGVIACNLTWELLDGGDGSAQLRARMRWERPELLAIFPFAHELELEARIIGATLTVNIIVRAGPRASVPVSFGFHPYLKIPDADRSSWRVELPASTHVLLDDRMIPTGLSEPFDRRCFRLGDSSWDDAFTGLGQSPVFAVSSRDRRIELEFLEGYRHAQLYAPCGENFVCFEPMTAPTNALVSGVDLRLVPPEAEFRAGFRISVAV